MKNAIEVGDYFMKELSKIKKVKEVKGKGLMIGAVIDGDSKKTANKCLEKGLLVNNATENTLRFLPALIITKKDIDKAIKILKEVL